MVEEANREGVALDQIAAIQSGGCRIRVSTSGLTSKESVDQESPFWTLFLGSLTLEIPESRALAWLFRGAHPKKSQASEDVSITLYCPKWSEHRRRIKIFTQFELVTSSNVSQKLGFWTSGRSIKPRTHLSACSSIVSYSRDQNSFCVV